jgi:hypothetical protein
VKLLLIHTIRLNLNTTSNGGIFGHLTYPITLRQCLDIVRATCSAVAGARTNAQTRACTANVVNLTVKCYRKLWGITNATDAIFVRSLAPRSVMWCCAHTSRLIANIASLAAWMTTGRRASVRPRTSHSSAPVGRHAVSRRHSCKLIVQTKCRFLRRTTASAYPLSHFCR